METGYRRPLSESDVFAVPSEDECMRVTDLLFAAHSREPTLFRAMRSFWWEQTVKAGLWKTLNDASQFTGPMFMSLMLKHLTDYSAQNLLILALSMYIAQIVGALGEAQYFQTGMRVGMQVRTGLMGLIFRKSLKLSVNSRLFGVNGGKVTNMISSDTESLQSFCEVMHVLWSAPVRILTSMVLLYYLLGLAAVCGAGVLVGMIPVQNFLVRKMTAQIRKAQQFTDDRLKTVTEVFEGIQIVKCYSWESAFRARLEHLREGELSQLLKYSLIRSVNSFLISAIPVLVAVVSFTAYSFLSADQLTAVQAFTALSLFQVLRFPLMQLPSVVNSLGACRVSLDRISSFLALEETAPPAGPTGKEIFIAKNSLFRWPSGEYKLKVPDELTIQPGELVVVVGHTASGKTSLLQAILGQLPLVAGTANFPHSPVPYCPQSPWIFSGSIRANVTFNDPYVDEIALRTALEASQFNADLLTMPDGPETELGERGVNLSGGQKHRLSLARAIYACLSNTNVSLVLLDDPLSALDASVANQVYRRAILGAMKNQTRILVTNRIETVISNSSSVRPKFLLIDNGVVKAVGTYEKLYESCPEFRSLVVSIGSRAVTPQPDEESKIEEKKFFSGEKISESKKNLISKENRTIGAVSSGTVKMYTKAMQMFPLIVSLYILTETARVAASLWLSEWSSFPTSMSDFLYLYVGISVLQLLFSLGAQTSSAVCGQRAARTLHYRMFDRLLAAPMNFFQATPLGRILNRFAKDTNDVDKDVSAMIGMTLSVSLGLISTLAVLAFTAYYTVVALIPLLIGFFSIQGYYRSSSREIKRMDAISRSPIYAHFQQVQTGIDTVIAFGKKDSVKLENAKFIDNHIRFNLAQMSTNRWLAIRLEFYGGALVLVTALFIVGARNYMTSGVAGLALSTALQVTGALGGIVRLGAMLENSMNSVERISEYTLVDGEKFSGAVPPLNWPSRGDIRYESVVAVYAGSSPLPVLRSISFSVSGGKKIGVVGRTGAGKTSLVMTLFRILEIQSGVISIDGIDIRNLSLAALRGALGIIPQDPIVFEGTVRDNIDPFRRYSDDQILDALSAAHLTNLNLGLGLVQGGKNLSAGQRQQICLARVLLTRPKILVLDEATSSLDSVTDTLVLETIKREFKTSTVITIAHRLHTVIDSDLILGLDAGELVEVGSPRELINRPNGLLASLIADTGAATAAALRDRIERH